MQDQWGRSLKGRGWHWGSWEEIEEEAPFPPARESGEPQCKLIFMDYLDCKWLLMVTVLNSPA